MDINDIKRTALQESGKIAQQGDWFVCTVCGCKAEGDVLNIQHKDSCWLYSDLQEALGLIRSDATVGEDTTPEDVMVEIISKLPRQEIDKVDRQVTRLQLAEDPDDRARILEEISEMIPSADMQLLTSYVYLGVDGNHQARALRLYLLFELAFGPEEKKIGEELDLLNKEYEGAKGMLKTLKEQNIPERLYKGRKGVVAGK